MFAGTAFGQALATIPGIPFFSSLPPVLLAMTAAAGMLAHPMRPDWHPSPHVVQGNVSQLSVRSYRNPQSMHHARPTRACTMSLSEQAQQVGVLCPATATRKRLPATFGDTHTPPAA